MLGKQYDVLESAADFVGRCRSSLRSSWSSICRKWWISLADIRCILNCTAPVLVRFPNPLALGRASESENLTTPVHAWANFSSVYYLLRQREIHSPGKEKSSAKVNPLHFHVLGFWASHCVLLPHRSLLHARVTEENLNLPLGFFRTSGICRNSVSSFGEKTQEILNSVVSCCNKR